MSTKTLPWLRLYTEIIDDEKLGLLAFEDRWHFIAILCLKGKGVLDNEPDIEMLQRKVALKMGLTLQELEKVVSRLARMGLIDKETFQPRAWDARQMHSDSSTERVKAYRERVKRERNVSVTAQDKETDKEEEKETPPLPPGGGRAGFDPLDLDDLQGSADLPEPHELPRNSGGNGHHLAGAVCLMAKRMGIGLVNPGNSKLNALLNAGVSVGQLQDAVQKALDGRKNFSYALSIVEREEREARDLADSLSRPKVAKRAAPEQKSFGQQEREAGWARWEQMTGRTHPDRQAQQPHNVIDITPLETQSRLEG